MVRKGTGGPSNSSPSGPARADLAGGTTPAKVAALIGVLLTPLLQSTQLDGFWVFSGLRIQTTSKSEGTTESPGLD